MHILVTSASGANGDGYGAVLDFAPDGELTGPFSTDRRIADPRGLSLDPFPRGFGFGPDGRLYLSSGAPPSGPGDNTIVVFDRSGTLRRPRLVTDPELSPLDLKLAPNGNIVVASEWPFGAADAVPSVREYDPINGQLVRVFAAEPGIGFRKPRGLRFGPGDDLYCVGEDHVVAFDFRTGRFAGPVVCHPRLNGQALVLMP